MSLYYGMHSMYDQVDERERLERRLEMWKQELRTNGIRQEYEEYCLEEIVKIEKQLAAMGGLNTKHSERRCECGSHAAGFSTHMHYCPLSKLG